MSHKAQNYILRLSAGSEDSRIGMICTGAGCRIVPPGADYPAGRQAHPELFRKAACGRTPNEFQLIYIAAGSGIFETNNACYDVKAGTAFLVLPGEPHFYRPDIETGWTEYWAGFSGEVFSRMLVKNYIRSDKVFFEHGPNIAFVSMFEGILEEASAQKPLYQIKICACIFSLIAELLSRERRKDQPDYYQKMVNKAKHIMKQNIFNQISIGDIALNIGVSASRLNEIFKQCTGITPYQYFIDIKLYEAKIILEAKTSVKEAAWKLGFKDQYYFSRLFKNKTGKSPSLWK